MAKGRQFWTGIEEITIDTDTLIRYRDLLKEYLDENDLWEDNHAECWIHDAIEYKLQDNALECRTCIDMLEAYWGFVSGEDDIDNYITRNIEKIKDKAI